MSKRQLNVVFWSGCGGETQRYRCQHAIEQLQYRGHKAQLFNQIDQAAIVAVAAADLVVVHRPKETHFWETIQQAAQGKPVVYETDDLLFDPALIDSMPIVAESTGFEQQFWRGYARGNPPVFARCDAAIVSTTPLAQAAEALQKPVWAHRNVLGDDWIAWCEAAYRERQTQAHVTIGYFSGTFSHDADLRLIAPALLKLLQQQPKLRLMLGGKITVPDILAPVANQIEQLPFVPLEQLPQLMSKADIILAPLDVDNAFTRCRSELKYLEAAALRLPVVASPIPAFAEAIRHGETGFLATSEAEWYSQLSNLLADATLRQRVGQAAYTHVLGHYTIATAAADYEAMLLAILQQFPTKPAQPALQPLLSQFQRDLTFHDRSVHMITGCDIGNAGNYRCRHRQEQLDWFDMYSGVTSLYNEPFKIADSIKFGILILHRVALDSNIATLIDAHQALGHPVIFDTDDLVFRTDLLHHIDAIKDWPADEVALYRDGVERYLKTMLLCDAVIVSTEPLAEQVRAFDLNAYVVRNALSQNQISYAEPIAAQRQAKPLAQPHDPVLIGYFSGTATHNRDFMQAEQAILHILATYTHVRLRIVGPLQLSKAFDPYIDRIERRELVPLEQLADEIAAVDFALAPLELDNPFCQSKSEVKYMEAALVGVPLIATPIEAFRYAITHGINGMLAANEQEWIEALEALVTDPSLRQRLGHEALADAHARYSPKARSRELHNVLQQIWSMYTRQMSLIKSNAMLLGANKSLSKGNEVLVMHIDGLITSNQALHYRVQELERDNAQAKAYAHQLEIQLQQIANGIFMQFSGKAKGLLHRLINRKG
ncbi:MAG TPA: hypothetical protein DEF47_21575 [Herpetosiphon sp.]|uniref:Glycosyl transferase group 1 n=1 Tax=Herpetosiphon aurantiacus (strain ATCC 23779 / DSM 785 / 114-95) TaxID=316274 RepID=A9AWZ8_HERA2|nr:glycosyltransferase family 4 protein [Herpetosiphon sp.]ABX04806.1 glycosyl transferase group 1 [Herpetosiphon aurantiacus DSM 785]HBW52482.1 hypothetical protein [Herpetosiphon sp.]